MKASREIESILRSHRTELEAEFGVRELGLFGSVVRMEQNDQSDIDILVDFNRPVSLLQFIKLELLLERLLGASVDLVARRALKPVIGRQILSEVIYI